MKKTLFLKQIREKDKRLLFVKKAFRIKRVNNVIIEFYNLFFLFRFVGSLKI